MNAPVPNARLPQWLRRPPAQPGRSDAVRALLAELGLNTVCVGAKCPNRAECFARGTATFMILGDVCSRRCRFCGVRQSAAEAVRADEPQAVAEAAHRLGLRHVVITSVTRDDLGDGGAAHFAQTIAAVRRANPAATVEVLTSDFAGSAAAVETVVAARPDVFAHNVETVPALYGSVRPGADYGRSLQVLRRAREAAALTGHRMFTKSGLMVGLGETRQQVLGVLADLRSAGCDAVTIGQYLQPTSAQLPVARFVPPAEFAELDSAARELGFAAVAAGAMVRSSYKAEELLGLQAAISTNVETRNTKQAPSTKQQTASPSS